jgi:uncharacterized protein (TIGR03083 family)
VIYVSPDRVIIEFLDELDKQGHLLAGAAAGAGLAAPVPSCPGWRVGDLLRHTGGVHRWAASIVGTPLRERPPGTSARHALAAGSPDDELLPWFTAGHQALVDTLRAAPADLDCWAFLTAPSPKAFWARRQAHETAIHRVDAELAAGITPTAVSAGFAADGVDELGHFLSQRHGRLRADPGRTILISATDTDRAWLATITTEPLQVTDAGPEDRADLTIRGPAADLYLLLWNRRGPDDLDLDGDTGLLDLWRSLATI